MRTDVDGVAETKAIPAALRAEVLERDGHCCRVCGAWAENPAIHHLVFRSQGGKHVASNLITVHWMYEPRCHEEYMHGASAQLYRRLGLAVAEVPGVTVMQLRRWEREQLVAATRRRH